MLGGGEKKTRIDSGVFMSYGKEVSHRHSESKNELWGQDQDWGVCLGVLGFGEMVSNARRPAEHLISPACRAVGR